MAKLYAELTSDKGGRVVGKGGNEYIDIKLSIGNTIIGTLSFDDNGLHYTGYTAHRTKTLLDEEIKRELNS